MKKGEVIISITDVSDLPHPQLYNSGEGFVIRTTKQEIKILIANSSNCCENWGHFSTNDNVDDFIGARILGIKLTNEALNTQMIKDKFEYGFDGGGIQFVDIETNLGSLQFAVYNSHNGYYSHSIIIQSEQLNHEGSL